MYTVKGDFLRIEYMVLAKYQHMSILELILIIKQHILIQGNMSSLLGNVVSNKCCLCVTNLLSSVN